MQSTVQNKFYFKFSELVLPFNCYTAEGQPCVLPFVHKVTNNFWMYFLCKQMKLTHLIHFFNFGTPSGVHLFDRILWPIFQSSISQLHIEIKISSSSYMFIWERDSTRFQQVLNRTDRLYVVTIQIWINSFTYVHWKIITLARIWTLDLPGTKLKW